MTSVHGSPLPPAEFSYGVYSNMPVPGTSAEHHSAPDLDNNFVCAVYGSNPPMADVQLSYNVLTPPSYPERILGQYVAASATYYWRIGSATGAPGWISAVPVTITIRGSASVSGVGNNSAIALASAGPVGHQLEVAAALGVTNDSFTITQTIDVTLGEIYSAVISASGRVYQQGTYGNGEIQAMADPVITIAADYPYREFFSVEFSENLPEPSSAALTLAAASLLALNRRRAVVQGS